MARTPRGRVATPAAWEHLGLPAPDAAASRALLAPGRAGRPGPAGAATSRSDNAHRGMESRSRSVTPCGEAGHDHSPDAVACWCVARAPLHFGSWSVSGHIGASRALPAAAASPLSGCSGNANWKEAPLWGQMLSQPPTSWLREGAAATSFLLIIVVALRPALLRDDPAAAEPAAAGRADAEQVMPGSRVRTTAGMYGTVVSATTMTSWWSSPRASRSRCMRRAIMNVVPDDEPGDAGFIDE